MQYETNILQMFARFWATKKFSLFYVGAECGTQQYVVGSGSQPSQREAEGILQELFSTDSSLLLPWQGHQW